MKTFANLDQPALPNLPDRVRAVLVEVLACSRRYLPPLLEWCLANTEDPRAWTTRTLPPRHGRRGNGRHREGQRQATRMHLQCRVRRGFDPAARLLATPLRITGQQDDRQSHHRGNRTRAHDGAQRRYRGSRIDGP
ncbi:MAG: hypothetical protein Q4F49_04810 [Pseudoxanthomonas suwonensis]|nr:hypothetical protein [Pseudoxanthomonas suwonensis]